MIEIARATGGAELGNAITLIAKFSSPGFMLVSAHTNLAKSDKYNTDLKDPRLIRQIPGVTYRGSL
ncbi:hypothetical protein A1332_17735 [Methylomonas methanica]|uniref:Uncharacterized protein n=1 Tax=Methylomonas methanica TaxID=421 RepID=A0A177M795_METMH|nr:hypothetical protein A1332_17735 [Methylomonas methanica]